MSLKKILLAISLMVVVACMGGASACPCGDLSGDDEPDEYTSEGNKPVGTQICVQAPLAPTNEIWTYEWMVYERGAGSSYGWRPATTSELSNGDSKLCITPTLDHCSEWMAVRVTIQTITGGNAWAGCIRLLCMEWYCYNPECPTMTGFCEEHATSANLPDATETAGFTYVYTIDSETVPADMTVTRLNGLAPGIHAIHVYTLETGGLAYELPCSPIYITVYAKPSGSLSIGSS